MQAPRRYCARRLLYQRVLLHLSVLLCVSMPQSAVGG